MCSTPALLESKQNRTLFLLLILAAGAALRFYALAAESFWFDETYSVWGAGHNVAWHIAQSVQRIFPPLYYLLLHFWLVLGKSEFAVRSLSVLIGLASIVAVYALACELFDARVGLLSAFLLTVSPLHLWYSQEARMYILVAALGLASAYFMLLALRRGRLWHWLAYVLCSVLAMNAHYFAVFLVPFQNLYVLYLLARQARASRYAQDYARRAGGEVQARFVDPRQAGANLWKRWLASQVAIGALSIVGLAGILSTETVYWWGLLDTWHGAPTWRDVVSTLFSFSLGTIPLAEGQGKALYVGGLLLFGFCAVWSILGWGGQDRVRVGRLSLVVDEGILFAGLYLVVPLGTVFLLSQFQSFWVLRYIFPFLPAWCIIVARGISRAPGRLAGPLLTAAILLASLWPIANTYRYQQKEDWRGAVQYIRAQERPGDLIVLLDEDVWLPFEYYYRGPTRRVGVSRSIADRDLLAARVGMWVPSYARIWLVLSHTDNLALQDYLETSRFTRLASEKHLFLVEVDLFDVVGS